MFSLNGNKHPNPPSSTSISNFCGTVVYLLLLLIIQFVDFFKKGRIKKRRGKKNIFFPYRQFLRQPPRLHSGHTRRKSTPFPISGERCACARRGTWEGIADVPLWWVPASFCRSCSFSPPRCSPPPLRLSSGRENSRCSPRLKPCRPFRGWLRLRPRW